LEGGIGKRLLVLSHERFHLSALQSCDLQIKRKSEAEAANTKRKQKQGDVTKRKELTRGKFDIHLRLVLPWERTQRTVCTNAPNRGVECCLLVCKRLGLGDGSQREQEQCRKALHRK
jgi:hypothetical protein